MKPLAVIAALVVAIWAAHYAYYLWPAGSDDRLWAKYVGDGAGFSMLCLLVAACARRFVPWPLLAAVAAWGAYEGLQQWACGLLRWGKTPNGVDLCIEQVGTWPYMLLGAAVLAWLVMRAL